MHWYLHTLKKYFTTEGRAGLHEFWAFNALNLLFLIVLFILCVNPIFSKGLGELTPLEMISFAIFIIYYIVLVPPSFAIQIRRLHDINLSGFVLLVNLIPFIGLVILLYLFSKESIPGENKYGPPSQNRNNAIRTL